MNNNLINKTEEEYALKDVMYLHWWLNQNINSSDDYLNYGFIRMFKKSYLPRIFNIENSIKTCTKENNMYYTFFYAITDNNRLLKCTIDEYWCRFELFSLASRFTFECKSNKEDTINMVDVNIKDDVHGIISRDNEHLYNKYRSLLSSESNHLVDLIKPISLDEILKTFNEIREEVHQQTENNSQNQYVKSNIQK